MTLDFRGLRCVSVVRSAFYNSIFAMQRQRELNAAFATAKDMSVVTEVFFNGVPYGVPKGWTDQILRRKILADDFDGVARG